MKANCERRAELARKSKRVLNRKRTIRIWTVMEEAVKNKRPSFIIDIRVLSELEESRTDHSGLKDTIENASAQHSPSSVRINGTEPARASRKVKVWLASSKLPWKKNRSHLFPLMASYAAGWEWLAAGQLGRLLKILCRK